MKKSNYLVSVFLIFALFLAACGPSDEGEIPDQPGFSGTTGDPMPGEIPGLGTDPAPGGNPGTGADPTLPATTEGTVEPSLDETSAATATVQAPAETETPSATQSGTGTGDSDLRGAQVIPETAREDATILSELLGYQVVDQSGATVGTIEDFILNLCEAHIVYVVVEADPSLELENGNLTVFPYEMVTLEEGIIDVDQRVITVNMDTEQFTGGLSISERLDLTSTEWESDIRTHWSEVGRLSNLSTDCNVPSSAGTGDSNANDNNNANDNSNTNDNANTNDNNANDNGNTNNNSNTGDSSRQDITRIAYATEVLDMQLLDGNGNLIGEVEEVLLEPESGWLSYMAIRLDDDGGLVLVPFGALNLDTSGDGTAQAQNLVLLVESDIFANAPTVDSLPADGMQGGIFDYWSQHVPMTREELP